MISLIKPTLTVFIVKMISAIIGFLVVIYFARMLGPEILGKYYLFLTVHGFLLVMVYAGIGTAAIKYISEQRTPSKFYTADLVMKTITLVIAVLIIFIFRHQVDSYIGGDVWLFLIIILCLSQYYSVIASALVGENKAGTEAILGLIQKLLLVSTQVVLIAVGIGLYGLLLGFCVGYPISIAVGFFLINVGIQRPSVEHYKKMFHFSKYAFGTSMWQFIYGGMDIVMIGLLLEKTFVGIYGICWDLTLITLFVVMAITTIIFPRISKWHIDKEFSQIRTTFSECMLYSLILPIPIFVGVVILAKPILFYVYGASFMQAWLVLIVLMGTRLIEAPQLVARTTLMGIHRPELVFRVSAITIVLNVVGNLVLISLYGFIGAAIATLLTVLVAGMMYLRYLHKILDIVIPYNEIKLEVISAAIMGVTLWCISLFVSVEGVIQLVMLIGFGAVVYITVLLSISERIRKTVIVEGVKHR